MQALVIERLGLPEDVLIAQELPPPTAGPGQVLIHVTARPIQPADFLFVAGRYRIKPTAGQVAGLEGVGTIVACGPNVTAIAPGARVAFRAPGAWAEYAVAPTSRIYPVPPGVPDSVACQFALNPLTAWGLLSECDLSASSRLLVTAGRSVVARVLVELAQRQQIRTALLVRDGNGCAVLRADTAHLVAHGESVAETLKIVIDAEGGFHAALDAIGGANTLALIDALEPGGRLISYGVLDDSDITLKASRILYKNMRWQGFGIDGWLNHVAPEELAAAQRVLWPILADKPDLLPIIDSFRLSEVRDAIHAVRTKARPGKILLV